MPDNGFTNLMCTVDVRLAFVNVVYYKGVYIKNQGFIDIKMKGGRQYACDAAGVENVYQPHHMGFGSI